MTLRRQSPPSSPPAGGAAGLPASLPSDSNMTWGPAAILLSLCVFWGLNYVTIKIGNRGYPPVFAAAVRSTGAAVLVALYCALSRRSLRVDRRRLLDGFIMGIPFALEFLFIYWGTAYTSASRAVLLTYTSPFWVAIGAHFIIPGDRLTWVKMLGLGLSFAGVAAVFGAPAGDLPGTHLLGDSMEVLAGLFWAGSTLFIKHLMRVRPMTTFQVLFYQLAFSAPLLWVFSLLLERDENITPRLDSSLALVYQTVLVATISYLIWFWLMRRQQASRLHSFTFFTPLAGVAFGGLILGEHLPLLLWLGLALVALGTYLVNTARGKDRGLERADGGPDPAASEDSS